MCLFASVLAVPLGTLRATDADLAPEAVSRIYIQGNAGSPSISNATPEGDQIFTRSLDNAASAVRGYIHYLRFDLSGLTLPDIEAASLTLHRTGGDGVSTGRVAIYGLLDLPGNTAQNWNTSSFPPGAETDFAMYSDAAAPGGEVAVNLAQVADFSAEETVTGDLVMLDSPALLAFLKDRVTADGKATLLLTMPSQGSNTNKQIYYGSTTYADTTMRPNLRLTYYAPGEAIPPENLRITDVTYTASPQVTLQWDAAPDAVGYKIFRRADSEVDPVLVAQQPGTTYVDSDVELLATYIYSVTTVTAAGESSPTLELSVAVADSAAAAPAQPQNVTANAPTTTAIPLSWSPVEGAVFYRVYRSIHPDRDFTEVAAPASAGVSDAAGVNGYSTYYYNVIAVGAGGLSPLSETLTVGPRFVAGAKKPKTPKDLAVTARTAYAASLQWEAARDASAYYVYRATDGVDDYRLTAVVTSTSLDDDYAIYPESTYSYEVVAVGDGGESKASRALEVDRIVDAPRQMEFLDRGVVAVTTDAGVFVSWRWTANDPDNVRFNVFRGLRKLNHAPLEGATSLLDPDGEAGDIYWVRAVGWGLDLPGIADRATRAVAQNYVPLPLQIPVGGTTPLGDAYTYSANDTSVADLDGDGEYEFIVKWDPSNSKDNSQSGYTGNVYLDAYKLDGTLLWRIDLGRNIRAGAHYTQFMVYDFDGDGKAELICKTADGTTDAAGTVIGDGAADWRNTSGYVLDGPEFLTLFNGVTGAAMDTIAYNPPRGDITQWGDNYGNRVDRFLNGVAYFDGDHPSFFACRGQYRGQSQYNAIGRTVIAAYDVVDAQLQERWVFDSDVAGPEWAGQGHHQLSVGDVDADGKDEILYGGMVVDDDGTGLYSTEIGHGDAFHYGDLDPTHPGREVFAAKEESAGVFSLDASTGQVLWNVINGSDTGRGLSADINPHYAGEEVWGAANLSVWTAQGDVIGLDRPSINFAIWWDGDPLRELLDGTSVRKWDPVNENEVTVLDASGTASNNGTKATPALQADVFGDWREEVVLRAADSSELRIYTTTTPTDQRITTLMQDPTYRLAVAWQNNGYNQPPHPSFYLGANMPTAPRPHVTVKFPRPW